ncbi:hypothetical protein [Amphiplicatus metriothermophilus]|uniref:Alginate export n=1 Tax=Amphiplicatus metriothermophilus TaxID=1519374 RepID=A0A239PR75_9PROT|nr:hypothetical protein [Amphiplicatus metriothermophilus]MBB5518452.1 hypothetical protein [Amphiplicatus metriothermophilus]SNT72386.1 hypothetical protein SAMN06297382_1426 [Amphiplicatus metriothermophilus]
MFLRALYLALTLALVAPSVAQEPPLPTGLAEPEEKKKEQPAEEPALPAGLGGEPAEKEARAWRNEGSRPAIFGEIAGFVEARVGPRLQEDPNEGAFTIAETRLRLESEWRPGDLVLRFVGDAVYDEVDDRREPDLEAGEGAFDLREANIVWRPLDFVDMKAGRQILTWGVGDLIFINDLFPKDFRSFFIGRDDEYLKAPSDAIRVSFFHDLANLDIVYTPRFDADRFIDGSRLSYFNPLGDRVVGKGFILDSLTPDEWFRDDEFAGRIFRNIGAFESAVYGYIGYFKAPNGLSPEGEFVFPRLAVVGASLRGPFLGGILTAEIGRYFSRDDSDGDDPLLPNSDLRLLVGFEREAASEFTVGFQYYAQVRSDHNAFLSALPVDASSEPWTRHLLTMRLTKLALNQNLTLSAFNFWSPNQDDGHLRLRASYKLTDDWLVEAGGNLFYGPRKDVLFSQLTDNTNIFFAVRRSF